MVDLSTSLKDLELKNPVLTASGTFGFGEEYADFIDLNALGGFVVKGTTLEPRQGNDYPRMAETPMGMLNCVGLQNAGVDHFIEDKWPYLSKLDSVPIVNVSGARIEDYVACAEKLAALDGLKAIELNISCPNVKQGGMAFGTTCDGAASVVSAVREVWPRHLMVKLSPNVTSIVDIAKAVEGCRCRLGVAHQYTSWHGCRRGASPTCVVYRYRWPFGPCRQACGCAYGMAGGTCSFCPGCGSRRHIFCRGRS